MDQMLEQLMMKQEEEDEEEVNCSGEQNVQYLNATLKIPVFYSTRNVIPGSIRFGETNIQVDPNFELGVSGSSIHQGPSSSGSFRESTTGPGGSMLSDSQLWDGLTSCIKNGKLDVIGAGQLILNCGGSFSEQVMEEFVSQNFSKITGTRISHSILNPNYMHALQIGNFLMVQVNCRKIEQISKGSRQAGPQQNIDLGSVVGSLSNMKSIFEVTADAPFHQIFIDLRLFDTPKKSLKQHIIMRDYLYQILTLLTSPPEAIKNYTYRDNPRNFSAVGGEDNQESDSEENEDHEGLDEGSNNMLRGRFKDLPEHVVKVLYNLFFEYYGFDSPIYTSPPDELDNNIEFLCLGNNFEERFSSLRERRQVLNTFTNLTFPSMLKNAFCEIRLSTIESVDGKTVWLKRKRVAGFRQLKRKTVAPSAGSATKSKK